MSAADRSAVVLSGGGAYAAYEVGVMTALFSGLCPSTRYVPLRPNILTGTSAGAFNAALLLCGDPDPASSVRWLQHVWIERVAGGAWSNASSVFRVRGNVQDVAYPPSETSRGAVVAELVDDAVFFLREMIERGINFLESPVSFEQRVLELWDFEVLVSADPFRRMLSTLMDARRIRQ
jgi:predicted acylesterase/phospholipase RssA